MSHSSTDSSSSSSYSRTPSPKSRSASPTGRRKDMAQKKATAKHAKWKPAQQPKRKLKRKATCDSSTQSQEGHGGLENLAKHTAFKRHRYRPAPPPEHRRQARIMVRWHRTRRKSKLSKPQTLDPVVTSLRHNGLCCWKRNQNLAPNRRRSHAHAKDLRMQHGLDFLHRRCPQKK